ncbi:hypothetical protein HZA96_04620 [Candidatus Woesearchaeota archaeon]|nr:hypothetical protein [Candidatus Woesearchaeota archaeon]
MIEFEVKKCKTKASYSAVLKKKQKLYLERLAKHFEVVSDAGIAAVVIVDDVKVIVHSYGELLFTIEDVEKIKQISEKIFKAVS